MNPYYTLAKVVTVVASAISLIVFITIPTGYFAVAYSYETAALEAEANRSANSISELIVARRICLICNSISTSIR